jgi:hypothetical protein
MYNIFRPRKRHSPPHPHPTTPEGSEGNRTKAKKRAWNKIEFNMNKAIKFMKAHPMFTGVDLGKHLKIDSHTANIRIIAPLIKDGKLKVHSSGAARRLELA